MDVWHLNCRNCESTHAAYPQDLLARLREVGMLRREAKPSDELIHALATEAICQFRCQNCGETSLEKGRDPFEDEAWPEAKVCVACSEPIPPERTELFPKVERCASCQASADRGEPVGNDREFCPRCGDVLSVRVSHGGVTRYAMHCPQCGVMR